VIRLNRVAGIALLALPVLSIVGFAGAGPIAEIDPFARGDVEGLLRAIHDNLLLYALSLVPFILTDVLVMPLVAAALYLAFRDRSPIMALFGAFAMLVGAVALVIHEVGAMALAWLALDFFGAGGPGGVIAGDPVILVSARLVSLVQGLSALAGQSAMGCGVGAIGILLTWAPRGRANPPRWIGTVGMIAGAAMLTTWLFLISHTAGGVATLVGEAATILMVAGLGVWFLRQPVETMGTQPPSAS
jgi:hypothetical protein